MLRKIRKVFASLGISAFLGTADQPAAGWILRIHIKGTKAIAEKKKKKTIRINQFTEALMVSFFKLFFFPKWFASLYFIRWGKEQ